jgi:GTP-binding protein HflX
VAVQNRTQSVAQEDAILVGVLLPEHNTRPSAEDPLEELTGLAESVGARVVGSLTQRRGVPDVRSYLGTGKLEELKSLVDSNDADVVIFDNDLSPAQTRNLEQFLEVKVLDRTELILDIFATRAQTHESRLAVELAQLEYSLPRLKRMWTHLSRLKSGIGMRGPGEKQLEVDRRLVEKRIGDLKKEVDAVHRRKEIQLAGRRDRMTVSLVGYTNAGKSTLLNVLTDANVLAKDQLFATLDTRTRRWQLPGWGPILLSDTVGFIRDLPHSLIASFRATLEEARTADLLLHVADASSHDVHHQIDAVRKVLHELHIDEKDTLLVLNKIDRLEDRPALDALLARYPNAVAISARSGDGLEELSRAVADALSSEFADIDVEASIGNGQLLAYLNQHGEVLTRQYDEERMRIHCRLPERFLGKVGGEGVTVHRRNPRVTENGHVGGNGHVNGNGHTTAAM